MPEQSWAPQADYGGGGGWMGSLASNVGSYGGGDGGGGGWMGRLADNFTPDYGGGGDFGYSEYADYGGGGDF